MGPLRAPRPQSTEHGQVAGRGCGGHSHSACLALAPAAPGALAPAVAAARPACLLARVAGCLAWPGRALAMVATRLLRVHKEMVATELHRVHKLLKLLSKPTNMLCHHRRRMD